MADLYPVAADSYTVDTGVLREVANDLDHQAIQAQDLLNRARSAAVPPDSWGILGESLGIYDLYNEVRDQADSTLRRVQDFLSWSAETLAKTAADYDGHEETLASAFRLITVPSDDRAEASRAGSSRAESGRAESGRAESGRASNDGSGRA